MTAAASDGAIAVAHCVRPNLFDAYVDSRLILPLVLANLASPRLWSLADKLKVRVKDFPDDGHPHGLSPFLRAAAKQIDRDFEHLKPEDVAAMVGTFDLAQERARLGAETVDTAIASIIRSCRYRMERGTLKADALLRIIDTGQFPAYCYSNIDIIRAYRRVLNKRAHPPAGLTSCVDEAALFAALTMTMPADTIYDCVMLSSPTHVTAFGRDGHGRAYWFFGKNLILSKAEWDDRVHTHYAGDAQQAFDDLLPAADRILGIEGVFDFCSGVSEISPAIILSIKTGLKDFFGVLPKQLADAFTRPIHHAAPSEFAPIFRRFLPTKDHAAFAVFLKEAMASKNAAIGMVAASYRVLEGCNPRAYLYAARHAILRDIDLSSPDSILTKLRALPLRQSIFDDHNRIAMPDETLLFGGGSERDMALLFHIALERTGITATTLITASDAFVQADGMNWSMATLTEAAPPRDADILLRWAD